MKKIIILYFLGALLLSGCMRDEFDTTRVEEGIAARVSLRVLLPDMDGAVSAGNTRTSANTRAVDADVENRNSKKIKGIPRATQDTLHHVLVHWEAHPLLLVLPVPPYLHLLQSISLTDSRRLLPQCLDYGIDN